MIGCNLQLGAPVSHAESLEGSYAPINEKKGSQVDRAVGLIGKLVRNLIDEYSGVSKRDRQCVTSNHTQWTPQVGHVSAVASKAVGIIGTG